MYASPLGIFARIQDGFFCINNTCELSSLLSTCPLKSIVTELLVLRAVSPPSGFGCLEVGEGFVTRRIFYQTERDNRSSTYTSLVDEVRYHPAY